MAKELALLFGRIGCKSMVVLREHKGQSGSRLHEQNFIF